ncbi:MAG: hypothetical protein WC516_08100 [Patescibacteria group bacterium]
MDSPKWFISCIFIFLVLTLVGNIVEGVSLYTEEQVAMINGMGQIQTSQASDPTVGGVLSYGGTPKSALDYFIKAVTADYSWLYDIDSTKTEAQCATAGGKWNSTDNVCMIRNEYYLVWILLYVPIMCGVLISFGLMIARLIRGA